MDGRRVGDADSPDRQRTSDWEIPYGVALRSSAMRFLLVFNVGVDFARIAYLTHLANFVTTDLGAQPVTAGAVLVASTIASVPGRLASGFLADRFPVRKIAAVSMAPFLVGVAGLALATQPLHGVLGAIAGGVGFGASIPVRPAMYVEYFGLGAFGRIMGIGRLVSTTGGFIGASLLGWLVDLRAGDYSLAWTVALVVGMATVPAAWLARPPTELQSEYRV